jgi:pyruvate formate lyase activating enzyme
MMAEEKNALHLNRYFPRFLMDVPATDVALIFRLKELAEKEIRYVFAGNC